MDKHSSIQKQVIYLKGIGLEICDERQFIKFLNDIPYQRSINQMKVLYADSKQSYLNDMCFYEKKSTELIKEYHEVLSDSHTVLCRILILENKFKNALFKDINILFKSNKSAYYDIVLQLFKETQNASKYAFPDIDSDEELRELYTNKIYKVINASTMGEIRDIFELLIGKDIAITNLKAVIEDVIPTTNEMVDIAKKDYCMQGELIFCDLPSISAIKNILVNDLANLLRDAIILGKYPKLLLEEKQNLVISKFSRTQKKKFFKDNQNDLMSICEEIDSSQVKSKIKNSILENKSFNDIISKLFETKEKELVRKVIEEFSKGAKETTIDVTSYRARLPLGTWVENYIIIKKYANISSFRNTISHGNTLLITLKPQKDKIYLVNILVALLDNKNIGNYRKVLYREHIK